MKEKITNPLFPGMLYVRLEEDGKEYYPVLALNVTQITEPDETEIGVYYLERVGKLKRTTTIEQ